MAAARARSGDSVSAAQAAKCTPARAISSDWNMSTMRCFTDWNEAMGRSNTTRTLAYSTASSSARSDTPTSSAASATDTSSSTRRHSPVWSPTGPERLHRLLLEHQPGQLAGGVERRDRPRPGATAAGTTGCPPRPGPPRWPSRRCGRRSRSASCPFSTHPAPLRRARARTVSEGMAVPLLVQGDGAPLASGRQVAEKVVGAEGPGGQRRHDRRREERSGQGDPAHLLEDDAHLQQAGPLARAPACPSTPVTTSRSHSSG